MKLVQKEHEEAGELAKKIKQINDEIRLHRTKEWNQWVKDNLHKPKKIFDWVKRTKSLEGTDTLHW